MCFHHLLSAAPVEGLASWLVTHGLEATRRGIHIIGRGVSNPVACLRGKNGKEATETKRRKQVELNELNELNELSELNELKVTK